jgi:hypothetical protein
LNENPDVFNELAGPDTEMKKDIEKIFDGLMRNLNQLSNVNYVPKTMTKEVEIRT